MEQRFEWVSKGSGAGGGSRQSIALRADAVAHGSTPPLRFVDVTAVKLEQVFHGAGQAGAAQSFEGTMLHVALVADGTVMRLKGSLSSRAHRGELIAGISALLDALHDARPDLTFREVKDPGTDRDSQIWGGLLLAMAVLIFGYGALDLGSGGGDLSLWAWVFVAMGAALAWVSGYLLIWPTLKAPETDVSSHAVAKRLAIADMNVVKWSRMLPNVMVAGPLEPNDFHRLG